jgi:hypothetical protein
MIEIHASRSLELNDVVIYVVMPKPQVVGASNPITKRVRKEEVVLREACPKVCPTYLVQSFEVGSSRGKS